MEQYTTSGSQNLYKELTDYEKNGVDIAMEGVPASPMQIVTAHMVREDITYMRDYELDDKGDVKKLNFLSVEPD